MENKEIKVLDHGFVRLVDSMGNDAAVVQAARVSYGNETKIISKDRDLIRYLMRHWHTSPFEMCLRGDTRIPVMPCEGRTRKSYRIKDIADEFAMKKPAFWLSQIKIRTINSNGEIQPTGIKYCYYTGKKSIFKVVTAGPLSRTIYITNNHPFMVPDKEGFKYVALENLSVGDYVMANGIVENLCDEKLVELWNNNYSIQAIAELIGKSKITAYRKLKSIGIDTSRRSGFLRKTDENLLDPRARSRKLKKEFCELCGHTAEEVHHIDQNPHNNIETNLVSLCIVCHNAFHADPFQLKIYPTKIISIEYVGEDDVYDLEVESDNHNFVAEGLVVHNCEFKFHCKLPIVSARQMIRHRTASTNEISGRYSKLPEEFYVPDVEHLQKQSINNKQGRGETFEENEASHIISNMSAMARDEFKHYNWMLEQDVAREIARINLPLSTYTEWYWKIDLHNLFHFLRLRLDEHAQYEIRVYAEAIYELIKPIVPISCEAFEDYVLNACTFSAQEMDLIRDMFLDMDIDCFRQEQLAPLSKREITEFKQKVGLK